MTWNVLTETSVDAPPWSVRGPVVAARVADLAPVVLGVQEGSRPMLDDLVSRLPERYRWVGDAVAPGTTSTAPWSMTRAP